mmetsp:Transcript_30079/g.70118  ORF Transcript_30079/g.70118 Transcript_30079/m.70118 type:complete len:502 (+) Transcript_30079:61-1566(+)
MVVPLAGKRCSALTLQVLAVSWLVRPTPSHAFIEELFGQAFGGGGQQFAFEMGDGGPFEMGGGRGGGRGRRIKEPKWPKGVSDKINKKYNWLKGTEWHWNGWRNVQFEKDGSFGAPTSDCRQGMCKWSANKGKVYILWGEAGLHELEIMGETPTEQSPGQLQGLKMKGKRVSDGDRCNAVFVKVYDHEAAELDKDLYEVLGLEDAADEADIKKAYRKLSIQYHPDKNPDEESRKKFNDIRDAYEILNDPDKKILYDTGGMEAVKSQEKGQVQSGEDVHTELTVTLEDLYNSGTRKANYGRRIVCRGCRTRPDSPKCQGCQRCPNEVKMVHQQVGPGMIVQQQQEVPSKEKCKQENAELDVHIEKGMRDGEQVTFPRMAEQRPGMIPGAIIFTLKTRKHKKFERRGDDLHMSMQVTLREALLGWSQKIKHLDGHIVEVSTTSVTRPLQVLKVKGEGMPLRDDPASFGDLYIKVEVVFPGELRPDMHEAIAGVFKPQAARPEL